MLRTILLFLLCVSAFAADILPDSLDDTRIDLPDDWPVASVRLNDVPLTKTKRRGRTGVYRGSATLLWRDGTEQVLETRWSVRSGAKTKETLWLKSDGPDLPKVRIDLKRVDGELRKARGRFRVSDGNDGATRTQLTDKLVTAVHFDQPQLELRTEQSVLQLDAQGRVVRCVVAETGNDLVAGTPAAMLRLTRAGSTVEPTVIRRVGDELIARFASPDDFVRLQVTEDDDHVRLRVLDVLPADATALRLQIGADVLQYFDSPLNGTVDGESAVSVRPITANGRCVFKAGGGDIAIGVEWIDRHGIEGGEAAFLVVPRDALFTAMQSLEDATGLPSPQFDGVRARDSATVRESYLFLTYYQQGDAPKIIEYAQVGGFTNVLFLRTLWRKSGGTYAIDTDEFPGGLDEFKSVCAQFRAAGIGVGLHIYGPSISADDPLVTPVPSEGLLAWTGPPLASDVAADATTLTLSAAPDFPANAGGGFPGKFVRVGDEIVRYATRSDGPPFTYTGCERGALGTTATAHLSGAAVRHLATVWDMFLIDPDGPLVDTVSANLASVVNAANIDFVYFDGTAVIPTNAHVDRWYYYNRLIPAHYRAFDHPVIVQTGAGPGRHLSWHVVPRSASADGHGDIRWYLDERTVSIESIRRGFSVPDVGWYGFDQGRPPHHLEYIASKCLGWDCPLSIQSFKIALEGDPRARETMEMLGRYQRFKPVAELPESVRTTLLTPQQNVRLLEGAGDTWELHTAEHELDRDVRTLTNGGHAWKVTAPADGRLELEIVRGAAIEVEADFSAQGTTNVETFHDLTSYPPSAQNDFARLVNRVQKTIGSDGIARAGTTVDWSPANDPAVGGLCAELTASNSTGSISWCAVGRTFTTPMDLDGMAGEGIWIKGDDSGVALTLELWDDRDNRTIQRIPVHFSGWRFHTFAFKPPAAFDRKKVKYLVLIAADLPPDRDVSLRFASWRATPVVTPATSLSGLKLTIGTREITLQGDLVPGGSARIDGLGRVTIWTGGMTPGVTTTLPGGPIVLTSGIHDLRVDVSAPSAYPGDLSVRPVHLELLHEQ